MELKGFIEYLDTNITEEAFEAMVLHFAKQHYDIIGCDFNIRDNVKIYKLHRRYAGAECYLVVNYYNEILDADMYPKDAYMIAENNVDTWMCLCDALYLSDRVRSRVPTCMKEICNCVFEFTKYPLEYFGYECQHKFFEHILSKHEKLEEDYLERLRILLQKCKKETLAKLTDGGLLRDKKDWNSRTNTVTLTYEGGKTKKYGFHFTFDGMVLFSDEEARRSFICYIVDNSDIQKFKERVWRFVNV